MNHRGIDDTALTGVAATQLNGGTTIDKRLGLNRHDNPLKPLSVEKKKALIALWADAAGILVDEISMADNRMFLRIDRALKSITSSSLPFGGVNMIVSGDFYQKPPIAGGPPLYILLVQQDV